MRGGEAGSASVPSADDDEAVDYGYCMGVFSWRRIQKKLTEDVGFGVLAAGNEPDFRAIPDFRKLHLGALQGLFDQVLQIALQTGR
jgi:transposase